MKHMMMFAVIVLVTWAVQVNPTQYLQRRTGRARKAKTRHLFDKGRAGKTNLQNGGRALSRCVAFICSR